MFENLDILCIANLYVLFAAGYNLVTMHISWGNVKVLALLTVGSFFASVTWK